MTKTQSNPFAKWQTAIDISPFQKWLGLTVVDAGEGSLSLEMPWRDELVSNPSPPTMHGGVLASLIDLSGLYTIFTTGKIAMATIDLRVDYHRPATPGPVRTHGSIIKLGSKISTAETKVLAHDGTLLASGRGVYLMMS